MDKVIKYLPYISVGLCCLLVFVSDILGLSFSKEFFQGLTIGLIGIFTLKWFFEYVF